MANEVRIRASLDDKVTGPLGKIRDRFDVLGKNAGFKAIAQGVGMGVGISSWGLLSKGISTATDFITDSINAASDLNETVSKSNVVFGSSANEIGAWGDTTAKALGLSKQESLEAAATFGNLFNQIGVGKPKVAEMSEKLVQLAGDLASFNNIDPTDALEKLRSGLAGEAEPLRTVGVFLSQQKVDAEAARLGFKQVGGQYSENAKILARYNIILRETTSAQGDFARTSSGMANQQRILAAELKNTEAEFGQKMIPVVIDAQKAFITLFDIIDGRAGISAEGIVGLGEAVGGLVTTPWRAFEKGMYDLGYAIGEALDPAPQQFTLAGKAADDFATRAGKDADDIVAGFGDIKEAAIDWRIKFHSASADAIASSKKVRDQLVADAKTIDDSYFDPLTTRADLYDDHLATLAANESLRKAKAGKETQLAKNDVIRALDSQRKHLEDLGSQGALTQKDIDQFEADAKASYKSLSKDAQAKINAVIARLRVLASYGGKTVPINVLIRWRQRGWSPNDTHGAGHGALEFNAAGAIGFTKGPMPSPTGGIMGEAGTEAYAILRNPKPIPSSWSGGVTGGATFNITVNAGAGSGLTPGSARQLADAIGPALYADMQRKGFLPRTGNGLRG